LEKRREGIENKGVEFLGVQKRREAVEKNRLKGYTKRQRLGLGVGRGTSGERA
jgi:hypothetical protein